VSTTPPPPNPPPSDPEALLRARKLELEIQQFERESSILERFKVWTPSLTALVAIGALAWTINAGITQLHQTQNAQDQDRFDKALTRLGSTSVSERLTGAAGLSLFLTNDQQERHAATLRFLATALLIEKNPNVREAILDTFSHVDPAIVHPEAREDALRTLLDLNRSAANVTRPKQASGQVKGIQESDLADTQAATEGLRASARAIVIFIKYGTRQRDFSKIDCTGCDLSSATPSLDLSNANFDHAVLAHATFSGTRLSGSSFDETDLAGTNFEGANLQKTRFTGTPHLSYALKHFQQNGDKPEPPDFACADVSSADFSGSLFFGIIESDTPNEKIAAYPGLFGTNLTGANLSRIGLYALPLARSKSSPPLGNGKVISYSPNALKPKYRSMQIIETDDWRFEASSPSFQRSWLHLEGQLQLASNPDSATLPLALAAFRMAPQPAVAPDSQTRCQQYSHSQGQ
jgi:uncharacterized protein YjbI with pentapeptide repeats